jgi:hypothetical protein
MKPTLEQWILRRSKMNGIGFYARRFGSGISAFITIANGRSEITNGLWIPGKAAESNEWRSIIAAKIRELRNTP